MTAPLFVGGEDHDFLNVGGTLSVSTGGGNFRGTHARCALQVTSTGSLAIGWGTRAWTAAASEFWAHARCYTSSGTSSGTTMQFFALRLGGNAKLYLAPSSTDASPNLSLYKRTNAGVATLLQAGAGAVLTASAAHVLDVYTKYQASGGRVKVYLNEVLIIDYTGDVTTDGATTLDSLVLGTTRASGSTPSNTYWSECLIQADDTRSQNVHTLPVAANGNAYTFDSGGFGDVNETTTSDASFTASATAGQLAQYTLDTSLLAGNPAVHALVLSARAQRGGSGPTQLEPNVRTAGADYYAAGITAAAAFDRLHYAWETNPATSAAWLASSIRAAGFNIGARSAT
jgi:hypothetical protein